MQSPQRLAESHIRAWLGHLGTRCSPTLKIEDSETRLRDYARALLDLPREVFADAALEAAARKFEFFPAYGALRTFLEAWWRDNKPRPPALPGADDPGLDREDRCWLAIWERARSDRFADGPGPKSRLGQIRRYRARAFAYLVRTDTLAADVAVRQGWEEPGQSRARSADELADAAALVQDVVASFRSHPLPGPNSARPIDQARVEAAAAFEREHGRKPGELSPGTLAAERAKLGRRPGS